MRLGWPGILVVMIGTAVLAFLLIAFGRFNLARPLMVSTTMLGLAIAMRWKLRNRGWFWITIVVLAALHAPFILFIPWTTKWVPAILMGPVGVLDLYLMLWSIAAVGKFMGDPGPDRT